MWKKRMESALNKYKEKRCECLPLKIVKKILYLGVPTTNQSIKKKQKN